MAGRVPAAGAVSRNPARPVPAAESAEREHRPAAFGPGRSRMACAADDEHTAGAHRHRCSGAADRSNGIHRPAGGEAADADRPRRDILDGLLAGNERKPARERLTLIRIFEELRSQGYRAATMRYAKGWWRAQATMSSLCVPGRRAQRDLPARLETRDRPDQWPHGIGARRPVRLCRSRMPFVRKRRPAHRSPRSDFCRSPLPWACRTCCTRCRARLRSERASSAARWCASASPLPGCVRQRRIRPSRRPFLG